MQIESLVRLSRAALRSVGSPAYVDRGFSAPPAALCRVARSCRPNLLCGFPVRSHPCVLRSRCLCRPNLSRGFSAPPCVLRGPLSVRFAGLFQLLRQERFPGFCVMFPAFPRSCVLRAVRSCRPNLLCGFPVTPCVLWGRPLMWTAAFPCRPVFAGAAFCPLCRFVSTFEARTLSRLFRAARSCVLRAARALSARATFRQSRKRAPKRKRATERGGKPCPPGEQKPRKKPKKGGAGKAPRVADVTRPGPAWPRPLFQSRRCWRPSRSCP